MAKKEKKDKAAKKGQQAPPTPRPEMMQSPQPRFGPIQNAFNGSSKTA
jgi:hypothetical protein